MELVICTPKQVINVLFTCCYRLSYTMIVVYITDHEGLDFSGQIFTLKPASQYLHSILAGKIKLKRAFSMT